MVDPKHSKPRNSARLWPVPVWRDISCLVADLTTHEFPPHWHETLVVAVTEEGWSRFTARGVGDVSGTGRVLVFNPGEPHAGSMRDSERWRYRAFYIGPSALANLEEALEIRDVQSFPYNVIDDAALSRNLLRLHRAFEHGDDPHASWELTIDAFAHLLRGRRPADALRADACDRVAAMMRAFIHRNFREPLRLWHIADAAGMNTAHALAAFKKAYGITPYAYLLQTRLAAAVRLIQSGLPTAHAALACGFYDQSAFQRRFKAAYGVTPASFARNAPQRTLL